MFHKAGKLLFLPIRERLQVRDAKYEVLSQERGVQLILGVSTSWV